MTENAACKLEGTLSALIAVGLGYYDLRNGAFLTSIFDSALIVAGFGRMGLSLISSTVRQVKNGKNGPA